MTKITWYGVNENKNKLYNIIYIHFFAFSEVHWTSRPVKLTDYVQSTKG